MVDKNDLFVEKYRPKSFDDLVLEPLTKEILNKFVIEKSIPQLLLVGSVGCGKTTIAKILVDLLDCDCLLLNASDERGIDVIREKIKRFAMMSSFKKWKIVFMDEADSLTLDAQFSLRNILETYSEQTRFIFTANYGNKIIEPIQSRCQVIEFKHLHRKDIRILLERILKGEGIKYDIDSLLFLIDKYYPDIRSMINNIQLYTIDGEWNTKGLDTFRGQERIIELIKKGDLQSIRELDVEYTEAYRYIFSNVEQLTNDYQKKVDISLLLAEFLYKDTFIADKSINFAAAMLSIIEALQ